VVIDLLGRYARVVDHLAVRDIAQGAPTACCAASMKPWTETILDDVLHYPVGLSVSDTGRPGQK
jgi:hypothetical protein